MRWVAGSTTGLAMCALMSLCLACTEEATDRPVFVGPDEMPGLRAGGSQNIAGYDRSFRAGVPSPGDFDLGGWLNSQVTSLPVADADADLTLHGVAAVSQVPGTAGLEGVLQIGLNSRRLLPTRFDTGATGDHIGLILAIDESGSMSQGARLSRLHEGLRNLIDNLPKGVHLGMVGFAGAARAVWAVQPWDPEGQLVAAYAAIDGIAAAGGTNTYAGLARAVAMAESLPGTLVHRHIILITDGRPSRGHVEPERFSALLSGSGHSTGLSVIGIGENIDDALLRRLAALGGGSTWLLSDVNDLTWAIVGAYRSMDGPLVEALQLEVTMLAGGWDVVTEAPGLLTEAFTEGSAKGVRIRQPSPRLLAPTAGAETTAANACSPPAATTTTVQPDGATTDWTFAKRPAVGHPGMFLLRLKAPHSPTVADLNGLDLARVRASYVPIAAVTGAGAVVSLERTVRLNADNGAGDSADDFVVSSSAIGRRSLALLEAGQAIQLALLRWHEAFLLKPPKGDAAVAKRKEAMDGLTPALARLLKHQTAIGAGADGTCATLSDAAAYKRCLDDIDPGGGLADAIQRVEELSAKMAQLDLLIIACP